MSGGGKGMGFPDFENAARMREGCIGCGTQACKGMGFTNFEATAHMGVF